MMDSTTLISKILSAKKLEDVVTATKVKDEFHSILKKIHPDICSDKKANEATARLNELKTIFDNGIDFFDESGKFNSKGMKCEFSGDTTLLKTSYANYNKLIALNDESSKNFRKYMPWSCSFMDNRLLNNFNGRTVPLSGLTLPQEHVNWILSRMLEYCAWLSQVGYVHCGLNPESIFVVPETHGIIVTTFYHLSQKGKKVNTICGRYKNWYPDELFTKKTAEAVIDIELAKKTAIYLLGDKSGSGIKLKKTHNADFIDFVIKRHENAYECFKEYRALLSKNFEKKFYTLDI